MMTGISFSKSPVDLSSYAYSEGFLDIQIGKGERKEGGEGRISKRQGKGKKRRKGQEPTRADCVCI